MYDCKVCMEFFVQCPCCKESFCPTCGKTESDDDQDAEEAVEAEDDA